MKYLIIFSLAIACFQLLLRVEGQQIDQQLLNAIRHVESGGDDCAIGDRNLRNKALGPYQIRRPYYDDAVQFNPSLRSGGRSFRNVWGVGSEQYSEDVIRSYMKRYATAKRLGHRPTYEDIARIHNGGPNGYKNPNTNKYWKKVQKALYSSSGGGFVNSCLSTCNPGECCQASYCTCLNKWFKKVSCTWQRMMVKFS